VSLDATPVSDNEQRSLAGSVSLLYAAVYLHYGVLGLFMPVWLAHAGIRSSEIGLLVSAPMLLRILFVAPVSALADHLRRIRELLFVCLAGTAVFVVALGVVHGFVAMALFFVALSVVWDPVPILADAYAVAAVRAKQLDFGRMRVFGSLGFVVANLAGGKVFDLMGIGVLPILTAVLLVVPLLIIPFLPPDRRFGSSDPAPKGEWRTLLKDRSLVVAILGVAVIVASGGLFTTFSAIHWSAKHFSSTYIGFLSAVGIASEVVVLWGAQRALGARSPLWLILVAGGFIMLRWLAMALDPGPVFSAVFQLLNGGGMGVVAGLMLYIAGRVPVRLMATAQGVTAVVMGVAAAVSAAGSGYVWQQLGPAGYLLMAVIAALGLAVIALELRRPPIPRPGLVAESSSN
jgi:PPP family 3-phenylpropionic acid transporter